MGQHYRSNTEGGALGFVKALWNSARWCHWVEPNEGAKGENANVLFFRNTNGLGLPPAKMPAPGQEKAMQVRRRLTVQMEDDDDDE